MKKTLLTLLVLAGIGSANTAEAQLADGSIAPNWTLTDVNGNSHTLYDYLDQGKTVVLDVFATWCSPCWSYAQQGTLDDVWAQYGPAGTDEMMVFSIEADASTTTADLNGTGSNTAGDWVSLVTNILIDDASVNGPYNIGYFPTIYMICPNRTITEVGQLSTAAAFYSNMGNCPAPASMTDDAALLGYTGETQACDNGDFTPEVFIQNNGTANMTAATINISQGGSVISTLNWTGNLATYGTETVTMPTVSNYTPGTITIDVVQTGDAGSANNSKTTTIGLAPAVSNFITVDVFTDYWASEVDWKIYTEAGAYVGGTSAPTLPDNAQTVVEYEITNGLGCYEFRITDSYGDGILNGSTSQGTANGALWVGDHAGNTIFNQIDYGSGTEVKFQVTSDATSVEEIGLEDFKVFPNPTNNIAYVQFNLESSNVTTVEVMNIVGQKVYSENLGDVFGQQNIAIDCSEFENGIYMVNITTNNIVTSKRIVVSK